MKRGSTVGKKAYSHGGKRDAKKSGRKSYAKTNGDPRWVAVVV